MLVGVVMVPAILKLVGLELITISIVPIALHPVIRSVTVTL